MSKPVYKFWKTKLTEAWYQLSPEEKAAHQANIQKLLDQVGGKTIVICTPTWSVSGWTLCGVEEFPSSEAVQQHTQLMWDMGHYRYFESESMLGTTWPPE